MNNHDQDPIYIIIMDTIQKLVLGYGNVDRQDDGVAWYVMIHTAKHLKMQIPKNPEEEFIHTKNYKFIFLPHLVPEIAETISEYDQVCFIDAHTGNIPFDLFFSTINKEFHKSPFTHHMTPETCLYLANTIYNGSTIGTLLSIRGYQFNFSRQLSRKTTRSANKAVEKLLEWLKV